MTLLEADQLQLLLQPERRNVFIFDCSWLGLPIFRQRNPTKEFQKCRIPGAQFFDIDLISDPANPIPHMLPSEEYFAKHLSVLCTKNAAGEFVTEVDLSKDIFVCYDSLGVWSAPRPWWMLKTFGAQNVFILNGGLCAWRAADFPCDTCPVEPVKSDSRPQVVGIKLQPNRVKSFEDMQKFAAQSAEDRKAFVFDARPLGRFDGTAPEPREGIPSGHISGALSLPYTAVVEPRIFKRKREELSGLVFSEGAGDDDVEYQYYVYKTKDQLKDLYSKLVPSLTPDQHMIFTCGSGITACVLLGSALSVHEESNLFVYDESWMGWQMHQLGMV